MPHEIRYDTAPVHYMVEGLRLYFEQGIPPGSFMCGVLENDLQKACGHADMVNRHNVVNWVEWLWANAPSASWGSPEAVQRWIETHAKQ
jgi:hypothetical protein